ncbi:MFS transporter [Nitrincola sp.]|uniref:MFS transporter n=1 Tax=Nitrincola sp. TaxID=1926584 RepID=UPI003A8EC0C1
MTSLESSHEANHQFVIQTLVLLLGVSVVGSNAFLMSPVMHDISSSLSSSVGQTARAVAAYGGALALTGLFLTGYVQRFGYKTALMVSGAVLTLGILSTGLAVSWQMLLASQAVAGLAAGIMLPTLYSMTAVVAPKGKESATLGKVITGWSLAMVAGVPLSAFIADLLSWRYAYFLVGGLSLAATLGFLWLPNAETGNRTEPTSLRSALKIPASLPTYLICFLYMVSFYGVFTFLGSHVQLTLHYSTSFSGLTVLAYGIGFGVAGLTGKRLDEHTPQKLIKPTLFSLALVYLSFVVLATNYWLLLAGCLIWGFANQLGLNCLVSILTQLDQNQRVRLMGIYSAVAYGGTMVAGITFGLMYDIGSFNTLLIAASALCLASFLISTSAYKH